MAKPIASRSINGLKDNGNQMPGIKVDEPEFWSPPKGLLLTPRVSRVPVEYAAGGKNMLLSEATWRSRFGTSKLETVAISEQLLGIMAVIGFVTPDQSGYLLRLSTQRLDLWNGQYWAYQVFNGFSGWIFDYWSFAGWADEVLMSNGVDRIFSYNPLTGYGHFLTQSPPAKHITTFGGRVIATGTVDGQYRPARTQWSVKNNDEDWSGDGSGFEDLYSAPGGQVDTVHGCFPLTDDTALMIREQTVWQMSTTGQVLTPFRFSLMSGKLGTKYPRAITQVPGGYAMITKDNVIILSQSNVQAIGDQVREAIISSITDPLAVVGKYDELRSEYRLAINNVLWRYSFREQGWSKDEHSNIIRDFTRVEFDKIGIPIDGLQGTIDSLAGTIDQLVLSAPLDSIVFVEANPNTYNATVTVEDPNSFWDWTVPQTSTSPIAQTNVPIEIVTGLIQAGSVRERSKVIEIMIEYECERQQALFIEYSADLGNTWAQYSQTTVDITHGPQILSVRKTIVGHNIQLRLRSGDLGSLRILSFTPRIVLESKVRPI